MSASRCQDNLHSEDASPISRRLAILRCPFGELFLSGLPWFLTSSATEKQPFVSASTGSRPLRPQRLQVSTIQQTWPQYRPRRHGQISIRTTLLTVHPAVSISRPAVK